MRVYRRLVWPLLERMDAERAHKLTLQMASVVQAISPLLALLNAQRFHDRRLEIHWKGLTFPNPVGLAAGLDKDALAPAFFQALGFGFVEVGSVTPKPQPGNPRPRVHRLPDRRAIVNSMGFPGGGAAAMAARLSRTRRLAAPIGINLGKNAVTPLEHAGADYVACLETLYAHGDYFVINVSSPNTMGLTSLQAKPALAAIVRGVTARRRDLALERHEAPKPLLVKISPDLTLPEVEDVLEVALGQGIEGIIATNTSVDAAMKGASARLPGGISGVPLAARSREVVRHIRHLAPADTFVIGVGGVSSAADAWAMLQDGADLVQLYTGMIFEGPGLVGRINRDLVQLMTRSGVSRLQKTMI